MKTLHSFKSSVVLIVALLLSGIVTAEQMPSDPIGCKSPAGFKPSVADFDYQVKYQHAFEVTLWSIPALAIYGIYRGATEGLGAEANTILAWSKPAKPNAELLTANNVTPYLLSQTDLRKGLIVVGVDFNS